jgi:hypothetical protein
MPKFNLPLPSESVDIGIEVFCRKTDKNVSRKVFAQAPPLPNASYARWPLAARTAKKTNHYLITFDTTEEDKIHF